MVQVVVAFLRTGGACRLSTRLATLVKRHVVKLQGFGTLPVDQGAVYLNEAQALLVCVLSRSPVAASVRQNWLTCSRPIATANALTCPHTGGKPPRGPNLHGQQKRRQ